MNMYIGPYKHLCIYPCFEIYKTVKCAEGDWTSRIFHMPSEVLQIGITAQNGIFTIIQANKE